MPIPEEKREAVTRALRTAFGVTGWTDIQLINAGHSAVVLRIVVLGSPFLLKIITREQTMIGPERQFTCMRAAAAAGLAPQVRYASIEDRLSITDFIHSAPFPPAKALVQIPALLRTLHALPAFPKSEPFLNTTCTFLLHRGHPADDFVRRFQASGLLDNEEIRNLSAWLSEIRDVYPFGDRHMVSSHNDLFKPDNMVYDGRRPWLVDWEAAFLNDRYADLAVVANLLVTGDAEEQAFLQQYFGRPPDRYERARFFLMRQLAHMFYAMIFLRANPSDRPGDSPSPLPFFQDLQRRLWSGEITLSGKPANNFGRVHWQQLLLNQQTARWAECTKIVAQGSPSSST